MLQVRPRFVLTLPLLATFLFSTSLLAQTIGKIIGRVTDAETGEPLVGAQVTVEGTLLGNITDADGEYFIINVPIGLQSVTASFIGYRSVTVRDERILAGQTTTIDFQLEPTVVEIEGLIVQGEREPLVPRDNTVSKGRVTGETTRNLPQSNLVQNVTLQAGIVRFGSGNENDFNDIVVRGGRPTEHAVFIDGMNVRSFLGSDFTPTFVDINVNEFAVEEVDVVTGGFSAEFGDAMSGVVNIVTRAGGQEYEGQARFETEEIINQTGSNYGLNNLQTSIGGPVIKGQPFTFFASGQLTGAGTIGPFVGGYQGRTEDILEIAGRFRKIPALGGGTLDALDFLNTAAAVDAAGTRQRWTTSAGELVLTGDPRPFPLLAVDRGREFGGRLPGSQQDFINATGKLTYQPTRTSKLLFSYIFERTQTLQGDPHATLDGVTPPPNPVGPLGGTTFDPPAASAGGGSKDRNQLFTFNYNQTISQTAERNFNFDFRASYKTSRFIAGSLFDLSSSTLSDRLGGADGNRVFQSLGFDDRENILGMNFFFDDLKFFKEDDIIALIEDDDEILNRVKWVDLRGPDGTRFLTAVPTRFRLGNNPFGLSAGPGGEPGFPNNAFEFTQEDTYSLAAKLDAQITTIYRITLGGDAFIFDFDNASAIIDDILFADLFHVEPRKYAGYVQNRLDFGDLVIDLGGRVDVFDPNADALETPFGTGFPFRPEAANCVPCGRLGSDIKTEFAPRLGVAHPVTENVQMRLSYGKFHQLPGFAQLYSSVNTDLTETNTNDFFGNPNLDWQETAAFEVGMTALLGPDLVLDVVGFNRDVNGLVALRTLTLDEQVINGVPFVQLGDLRIFQNVGFGTIKGLDLTLRKRFSNFFSGDITYSFLNARSTETNPVDFVRNEGFRIVAGEPERQPPVSEDPNNFDVTHTFNAVGAVTLSEDFAAGSFWNTFFGNSGLFFTLQGNSGRPFTRQDPISTLFVEPSNSSRRGWDFFTNVRVTKGLDLAGFEVSGFIDVRNLFNTVNLSNRETTRFGNIAVTNGVFQSTGSPVDDGLIIRDARSQIQRVDEEDIAAASEFQRDLIRRRDFNGDGVVDDDEAMVAATLANAAKRDIMFNFGPPRTFRGGLEFRF